MNKQLITIITLLALVFSFAASITTSASTMNFKKGDWIEYRVTAIGDFPGEHNAKWARIEIVDVQGEMLHLNVTTQLTTGSYVYYNDTVDYEKGELMEGFFLPSNLTVGDVFYDTLVGNITVSGFKQIMYAGAERTIVVGLSPETTYYWDKTIGIMVEAHSSYPDFNYTIDTIADKTNMWQPQILGLEPPVFYAATIGTAGAIAVAAVFLIRRRKKAP